jgi:hypothetical protein
LLASDHFSRPFQQSRQNLKGLFLQSYLEAVPAQLPGTQVGFKVAEAHYISGFGIQNCHPSHSLSQTAAHSAPQFRVILACKYLTPKKIAGYQILITALPAGP